jgi:hypothetical protein
MTLSKLVLFSLMICPAAFGAKLGLMKSDVTPTEVVCSTRTPTGQSDWMLTNQVRFNVNEIKFFGRDGYSFSVKVSRYEVLDWVFQMPGYPETLNAKKYILYSENLPLGHYFITEDGRSYFNQISSDVSRLVEPNLFQRLVSIHGMAKALEISPWMLGTESCGVNR